MSNVLPNVNCKDNNASWDDNCPVYLEQQDVQKIVAYDNVSGA